MTITETLARTRGAELASLRKTGLQCHDLWEMHRNAPPAYPMESVLYRHLAECILGMIEDMGMRSRSWTHFRMASAIIHEIATMPRCAACNGSGCDQCSGSGFTFLSSGTRASLCGCHKRDFKDRLAPLYQNWVTRLLDEMKKAPLIHSQAREGTGTVPEAVAA